MPHIHLEYSQNIENFDVQKVLHASVQGMLNTQLFECAEDIKARAYCNEHFLVGLNTDQAYVYIKISLWTGRTLEQKQMIKHSVFESVSELLRQQSQQIPLQICVELSEIDKQLYAKTVILPTIA